MSYIDPMKEKYKHVQLNFQGVSIRIKCVYIFLEKLQIIRLDLDSRQLISIPFPYYMKLCIIRYADMWRVEDNRLLSLSYLLIIIVSY